MFSVRVPGMDEDEGKAGATHSNREFVAVEL